MLALEELGRLHLAGKAALRDLAGEIALDLSTDALHVKMRGKPHLLHRLLCLERQLRNLVLCWTGQFRLYASRAFANSTLRLIARQLTNFGVQYERFAPALR